MFGFSFGELLVISLVTLVAVGPQKLPGMLKTMGQWARKLRKMTMDVRQQTGIDEMLRAEGIQISELRTLMRGYHGSPFAAAAAAPAPAAAPSPAPSPRNDDPYSGFEPDPTREYPPEGADAYGALPDDLLEPPTSNEVGTAPGAPDPKPEPELEPVAALPPVPEPAPAPAEPAPTEPVAAAPVAAAPVAAAPVAAAPVAAAPVAAAAVPAPVRSVPPPAPSSRPAGTLPPRPAGTPPPPPRRTVPPRPESSSPVNKSDAPATAPVPPSPGTPNGNG